MYRYIMTVMVIVLVGGGPALGTELVAKVGDLTITLDDLEKQMRPKLIEIENARYEALREGLEEMIYASLIAQEAAARGVTAEALEKQEIADKVAEPSAEQVQAFYDENKEQLQNASFDVIRDRLAQYLMQRQAMQLREAFRDRLEKKYATSILLRPPVVEVKTAGRPSRGGGTDAPVTIVEFSDYECPFCKRAEETVARVLKAYGDKVRLVYRHYPLPFHANARPAAEAAHCAEAQGKFWPYHEKLMASEDLGAAKLVAIAEEVGLDRSQFDDCVAKKQFAAIVEQDLSDGAGVGVNGTPAFFINGRMIDGAQPFERFQQIIDEELAAKEG